MNYNKLTNYNKLNNFNIIKNSSYIIKYLSLDIKFVA